jgi:hypothetical protein
MIFTAVTESDFPFETSASSDGSYQTATSDVSLGKPGNQPRIKTDLGEVRMPEPVLYTPSVNASQASSIFDSSAGSLSSVQEDIPAEHDGYESPPPANDRIADIRNERRYRLLLTHVFHPSCTSYFTRASPIANS